MNNLQLDYLDCFLIHWPGKYLFTDTWRAFIRLYEEKAVRVIGVCNFNIHHLETVEKETGVLPMVNQFESHPYYPQNELADYCRGRGILAEAWSPMMCGGAIFADPTIGAVAGESGRTPAQVILRWHIQKGHRIFPKSVHADRIDSNFRIFDFALDDGQMERINALDGKTVFEQLMEHTEPEYLSVQLNQYWLLRGLVNPLQVLEKYHDRVETIVQEDYPLEEIDKFNMWKFYRYHPIAYNIQYSNVLQGNEIENILPVQCELFTEIGDGMIAHQPLVDLAVKYPNIKYVILKQDYTGCKDEFDSIRRSAENYKTIRGVEWE